MEHFLLVEPPLRPDGASLRDTSDGDGWRCDGGVCLLFVLSIRVVVTAEHTEEDIQQAVSCIREAAAAFLK